MGPITLDPLSIRPLYLQLTYGDDNLGVATGFCWEEEGSRHLITNWHVLSGINPENDQPISEHGSVPDRVAVSCHSAKKLGHWEPLTLDLYDRQQRPKWLIHPEHGTKVDLASIPIDPPEHLAVYPLNTLTYDDFRPEVSFDVFVLGFPRGLTGAGKLPIWKRGTIASEPQVDLDGLPKLLIDTATREGMSGAPVVVQYTGFHQHSSEGLSPEDWFGRGRNLLGVYSGRLEGREEFEAQLGIVWKLEAVKEVVSGGCRPR